MNNMIQMHGNVLDIVLAADVASSGVVVAGDLVGFAQTKGVTGETIAVAFVGVYQVSKATGQAWAQGTKLYYDATANNFTTTASTNKLAGHVAQNEIASATSGRIRLSN